MPQWDSARQMAKASSSITTDPFHALYIGANVKSSNSSLINSKVAPLSVCLVRGVWGKSYALVTSHHPTGFHMARAREGVNIRLSVPTSHEQDRLFLHSPCFTLSVTASGGIHTCRTGTIFVKRDRASQIGVWASPAQKKTCTCVPLSKKKKANKHLVRGKISAEKVI